MTNEKQEGRIAAALERIALQLELAGTERTGLRHVRRIRAGLDGVPCPFCLRPVVLSDYDMHMAKCR